MFLRLITLFILFTFHSSLFSEEVQNNKKEIYSGKKLKALLITGGCCHNYTFQSTALTSGIEEKVNVEFTVVNEGGNGTKAKIALYNDPDWAKPYDVIVHNECFAGTLDPDYIKKITNAQMFKPVCISNFF